MLIIELDGRWSEKSIRVLVFGFPGGDRDWQIPEPRRLWKGCVGCGRQVVDEEV